MRRVIALIACLTVFATSAFASPTSETTVSAEPRTMRLEIFDRGNTPAGYLEGGKPAVWVQETFGTQYNVKVEWVPVTRSKEVEQLNLMMAAKTAPDLVFTYDYILAGNYANQGGLADLTDLVRQYGPDLQKFLGQNVMDWGVWNGKLYAIHGKRSILGISGTWIRQDWLDKLGMPQPKTRDEFVRVLRAFRDRDPGGVGANLVPLWVGKDGGDANIFYSFYELGSSDRDRAAWIGPASTILCRDIAVPGHKEALKFLNGLYNEGLLTKDFWLYPDQKAMEAAIANGYVGAFTNNQTYIWSYNVLPSIEKNSPQSVWRPIDPFQNSRGQTAKFVYSPIGITNMVPSFSQNADLVVKYLNWMAALPNLTKLIFGDNGTHYDMNAEGLIIPRKLTGTDIWDYNALDRAVILNGRPYDTKEKVIRATVLSWVSDKYPMSMFLDHFAMLEKDGVPPVRFERSPDSYLKLNTVVLNKGLEINVKAVSAPAADFEAVYQAGLKEFMDAGARQIKEDLLKEYDAEHK